MDLKVKKARMKLTFKLRDYQERISNDACEKLKVRGLVYLSMEVRTGKTLTALQTAENFGAENVLFLTKKKAIKSIEHDYTLLPFTFNLTVLNDESLHKIDDIFDLIIHDEHHRFGAYPKPNKIAKLFKQRYSHLPMIFLSGTPTPESHSQWFHQFWISDKSPFKDYKNFYKWAHDFVNVKIKHLGYAKINDYSDADRKKVIGRIRHYLITYTQKEAGFNGVVNEHLLSCRMDDLTYKIINRLKKDKYVKNKAGDLILGDTAVKLMQKCHQLYSGTVKFEDGTSKVIDYSKVYFIKEEFKDNKIAIFYKFKAEYKALKEILKNKLTNDLNEFNNSNKWIALQIVSGREGISLKKADCIVYYNIDFSAVSYWQSRDRLTTMERQNNNVYWVFSQGGIENRIYQTVMQKKNYTSQLFKKDYGI